MSQTMYIVRTRNRLGPDNQPYEMQVRAYSAEQARKRATLIWGDVAPEECVAVTVVDHLCGKTRERVRP